MHTFVVTILVKETHLVYIFQIEFANFRYTFANICEFVSVCTSLIVQSLGIFDLFYSFVIGF